jgi:hypothetical protein
MEKNLKTCILISLGSVLALLVSFAVRGIDSFRYDYRGCYAKCIVDRFNDLKAALRSGELSREDAEMYWEEEMSNRDERCVKKIHRIIYAVIYTVILAFILLLVALYAYIMVFPFIRFFIQLIHRLIYWLLH